MVNGSAASAPRTRASLHVAPRSTAPLGSTMKLASIASVSTRSSSRTSPGPSSGSSEASTIAPSAPISIHGWNLRRRSLASARNSSVLYSADGGSAHSSSTLENVARSRARFAPLGTASTCIVTSHSTDWSSGRAMPSICRVLPTRRCPTSACPGSSAQRTATPPLGISSRRSGGPGSRQLVALASPTSAAASHATRRAARADMRQTLHLNAGRGKRDGALSGDRVDFAGADLGVAGLGFRERATLLRRFELASLLLAIGRTDGPLLREGGALGLAAVAHVHDRTLAEIR